MANMKYYTLACTVTVLQKLLIIPVLLQVKIFENQVIVIA